MTISRLATISCAVLCFAPALARAEDTCAVHLTGARVLLEINPQLHTTRSVQVRAERQSRRDGKTRGKPAEKVAAWLAALEQTQRYLTDHPERIRQAKAFAYRQNVIKPEDVSENYFITQARILRNEGYGDVEITPQLRARILSLLVQDQAQSLEPWLDYLWAGGATDYPVWMKYWILNGVVKLSIFDPDRHAFGIRNRQTVAPFPDLNPEALGKVKDLMLQRLDKKALGQMEDQNIVRLIRAANFGLMYGHEINKLSQYGNRPFTTNEGRWVRYPKGSNHLTLVESLVGQNTGWCTTGRATARDQLAGGDFHVYYSRDENGEFTRPRLAIRMLGNHIAEIRGVGRSQEFDPMITQSEVLDEKLKEFGHEADQYRNRSRDIKRLTEIDQRVAGGGELTLADLRFLREVDRKIQGFGFVEDPRIEQLLKGRDLATDLGLIFDVPASQVTTKRNDLREGNKAVFVGDLKVNPADPLPSLVVVGNLEIKECSAKKLEVPPIQITGKLSLFNCDVLDEVDVQAEVRKVEVYYTKPVGKLKLSSSVESLDLGVRSIGELRGTSRLKHLKIDRLERAGYLELPATKEHWELDELVSVDTLVVAPGVTSVYLPALESAGSIELPEGLKVLRLTKFKDLSKLHALPRDLSELLLGAVTSLGRLGLPPGLERLWLDQVVDARKLPPLPSTLKSLELDSLEKANGLVLPENLETLWLPKLKSARGLKRPEGLQIYRGPTDFDDR